MPGAVNNIMGMLGGTSGGARNPFGASSGQNMSRGSSGPGSFEEWVQSIGGNPAALDKQQLEFLHQEYAKRFMNTTNAMPGWMGPFQSAGFGGGRG